MVRDYRALLRDAVLALPLQQSLRRRAADAQGYWTASSGDRWASDSHLRNTVPGWDQIGPQHRELFETFARGVGVDLQPARVLEWGCGGGANAVAFAPSAMEFIGVDVSPESLAACATEVANVCSTPFISVLVGVDTPEDAMSQIGEKVDLFLCAYVFELLPSKAHAERVLAIAARLLRPGGSAMIQIKYQTSALSTRARSWSYRRQIAAMTSFQIPEFWQLCIDTGLTPHLCTLVPKNQLDERYAYLFLTRR